MKPTRLFAVVVTAIGLLFSYGVTGAAPPLRAQHALGVQRILVLAVSFSDVPDVPSLGQMKQRMLDEPAEYYALASHGKTQLQGEIRGWYKLPRPLAEYKVAPENTNIDRQRVRRLVEDAFNAADKDVVFDRYDHVIIVVGVRTQAGVGYGSVSQSANPGTLQVEGVRHGRARMEIIATRGGQRFSGGIVIMAQNARVGQIVHDLAHALGGVVDGKRAVPDLYDTVLQGRVGPLSYEAYPKFTVFMGPWDVMSRHLIEPQLPPPGMSSFTRLRMGWIGSDQVVEVTPEEKREVTLSPLADGKGTLVIKVPGQRGTYYLVENRQKSIGDPVLPATGIVILHVDESREDGDGIVRVVDANPKVPDFGAAAFGVGPGQTASARLQGNIAVEVLSQRGTDLTVIVTKTSRVP
jgi:M6 family metalloprotease-like protein